MVEVAFPSGMYAEKTVGAAWSIQNLVRNSLNIPKYSIFSVRWHTQSAHWSVEGSLTLLGCRGGIESESMNFRWQIFKKARFHTMK